MTALTAARATLNEVGGVTPNVRSFPVAASVLIYQGAIVMLDAGYAKPGERLQQAKRRLVEPQQRLTIAVVLLVILTLR